MAPAELDLRLSDLPVREHLAEQSRGQGIPKGVVAGHALAHLMGKLETKKADALLAERAAAIKKKGNPSRVETIVAPKPIIDWLGAAAVKLDVDERALVETAIELWYEAWDRKTPRRAA